MTETRLEERLAYLRALIENSPLATVVHDTQGRVQMCNRAFESLFQYGQAEVVGSELDQLIAPGDLMAEATGITRRAVAGQPAHITTRRRRKDGTLVDVELHGVPLTADGKVTGAYGLYQDITERKQLEQQLQLAQKMQAVGRLAGGVAHDFNNILGVIKGYSELQLERLGPADPLRSSAEEIKKAADRAAALTRQLLAFGRKQVLRPKVLDLNAVVADIEKMLLRLIEENIELVVLPGEALGRVEADPGQIEQVIINLALNARDAMPQGGRLTIETANVELDKGYAHRHAPVEPGRYVVLAVSDTGLGMDAETRAHVFEPFFTTKAKGKGTGLGLATVYGIVKQSGGYIWVYSEPGRGSTFKIYLPYVDQPAAEAAAPAKAEEGIPCGTETVLLVEDEESVQKLARKFLELSGYIVLLARDGNKAIQVAEWFPGPIHVLLTDVVMPNMSGNDLAKHLTSRFPELKVLYMSGYTDGAIASHGVLDPGTAFIQKPFTRRALAQKVREVLEARK